eukprot:12886258-Prorocentrum_lima.AAC.1
MATLHSVLGLAIQAPKSAILRGPGVYPARQTSLNACRASGPPIAWVDELMSSAHTFLRLRRRPVFGKRSGTLYHGRNT